MPTTLANADTYVAKVIGGAGSTSVKSEARDALKSAYHDLMFRHEWGWLAVDTSKTFTALVDTTDTDATLAASNTNGLKYVMPGMSVTGTGIPADTTISSITNDDSVEMSGNANANGVDVTATFSGGFAITAGTAEYNLPWAFWKPIDCRLTNPVTRPIDFIKMYDYNAVSTDQTVQGTPTMYTIYNGEVFNANTAPDTFIRFIRTPAAADVVLLRYWRLPDWDGTYLDVPDMFVEMVMDYARVRLLESRDATNERLPAMWRSIEMRISRSIASDKKVGGTDQVDRLRTPNELGYGYPDGNFWPRGDVVYKNRY